MENPTYFATPRHFLSSRALFFITRQHNTLWCELFFPCSTKIHQLMALNYSSYSSATSPLIYMMVNIFPYQISTSTCAVWSSYQKSFASKVSCSILFDKKSLSEIFFAHNTKLIFVGSSLSAFWQLHPYHFIHWSKNYSEILVCFCYDAIWNNPSGMKRWVLKFFYGF